MARLEVKITRLDLTFSTQWALSRVLLKFPSTLIAQTIMPAGEDHRVDFCLEANTAFLDSLGGGI